jgi:HipA-like protein
MLEKITSSLGFPLTRAPQAAPKRSLALVLHVDDDEVITVGHLGYERERQEGYEEAKFVFTYSDEFKESGLPAITGFPDVHQRYESPVLWPFFQVRLPPSSREDVARAIAEHRLDTDNVFEMLRVLGRHSATSPYELRAN